MFKVTFDKEFQKRIDKFVRQFPETANKATAKAANFALERIVRATPGRTGVARRSWRLKKKGAGIFEIASIIPPGSQHTPHLEYGTGIYGRKRRPIRPVKKKILAFQILVGNTPKIIDPKRKGTVPYGALKGAPKSTIVFAREVKGIKPVRMIGKNLGLIGRKIKVEMIKAIRSKWGKK